MFLFFPFPFLFLCCKTWLTEIPKLNQLSCRQNIEYFPSFPCFFFVYIHFFFVIDFYLYLFMFLLLIFPFPFLAVRRYDNATTCGLVWTANFVAYRCRTCGISPCMSLCAQCFQVGAAGRPRSAFGLGCALKCLSIICFNT